MSKEREKNIDMLNGSLFDKLFFFAMPLAATSILQQLFNSVDVAVVGRFDSSTGQAAVGCCGPVINVLLNLFIGISIGANIVAANAIGSKDNERARRTAHTAVIVSVFFGIFLLIVGQVIARPLLQAMNTPQDTIEQAVTYLKLYFLGMPVIMLYNFASAILRSVGDTRHPLYALILSGVVNTLLNMYLVIFWHMGVAGVAIATVISNIISSAIVVYTLFKTDERIRLHLNQFRISGRELAEMVRIGLPAGIQTSVFSFANVFVQAAVNIFGSAAMAGSSITLNFEFYTYYVLTAFAQAVVTFTSQNIGAGRKDRCKTIYKYSFIWSEIFMISLGLIFTLGRYFFLGLFSSDPDVINYACIRMVIMLPLYWIIPAYEIPSAGMRGLGFSSVPAWLNVAGICGLRLIWLVTAFAKYTDYKVLMYIYPISWIVTAILCLAAYRYYAKKVLQ